MRLILALIAVSLVGADTPSIPSEAVACGNGAAPASLTYDVKLLEMNGLAWRGEFYPKLQKVSHRGIVTVWTAPGSIVSNLREKSGKVLAAPQIISMQYANATVFSSKTRRILGDLARHADGPVNHASYVAYTPQFEEATEGYSIAVKGRRLDQGVLVDVSLEDKHITAVHTVSLTEAIEGSGKNELHSTIQVPEFGSAEVAGEWLIPNDGVLIVSLGVHTAADSQGKAVARERLALIEARPTTAMPGNAVALTSFVPAIVPSRGMALPEFNGPAIPMPAPLMPTRSLPEPLDAQGEFVALPPLPDELAPPTALPGSETPCATPQFRSLQPGEPQPIQKSVLGQVSDREMNLTGIPVTPPCCDAGGDCPFSKASAGSAVPSTDLKPLLFRFPLNGKVTVEVRASVTRSPIKDSPPAADKPVPIQD